MCPSTEGVKFILDYNIICISLRLSQVWLGYVIQTITLFAVHSKLGYIKIDLLITLQLKRHQLFSIKSRYYSHLTCLIHLSSLPVRAAKSKITLVNINENRFAYNITT